jgi:hypothetical protein
MSVSKKNIYSKYAETNLRKSLDDGMNILSEQTKMDLINLGLIKKRNRFENTMKEETLTRSMKLNQEIKTILRKKQLSQCSSPKLICLRKANETIERKKTTPIYQYNKKSTDKVLQRSRMNSVTKDFNLNNSNVTVESKNSINIHFNDDGIHNININNIVTVSDEVFYKDKRYVKLKEKYSKLHIEKTKILKNESDLKRTIEILSNYIKIQNVNYNYIRNILMKQNLKKRSRLLMT